MVITIIEKVYSFLWGDLITLPLPGGGTLGISLLILLLIPTGIYFTIRTKFLPIRLFPDMIKSLLEKKADKSSLSSLQTLLVSTATRVGMGNLVGVVAAISAGGAGAVFWMWITALIGSSTAFIEATLAQLYKQKDPLYGGYRGGPAYYIHAFIEEKQKRHKKTAFCTVCDFRSDLLVRYQPGYQQFGCIFFQKCIFDPADLHRCCIGDPVSHHCPSQKCNGKSIRYDGSCYGSLLFYDHDSDHRFAYSSAPKYLFTDYP